MTVAQERFKERLTPLIKALRDAGCECVVMVTAPHLGPDPLMFSSQRPEVAAEMLQHGLHSIRIGQLKQTPSGSNWAAS
jgi:hypothetical protein